MNRFLTKLNARLDAGCAPLVVGLDPQPSQKPAAHPDLRQWNLAIIEATSDLAAAYKPNIAFYEALGREGFDLLEATLQAIPEQIPVILDAKRGDIGSTAEAYARACFEFWDVDAVTLSPYLGADSIRPFSAYQDRYVFVLAHTSNPSAADIQTLACRGVPLYEHIAHQAPRWGQGNVGLVVGATYPDALRKARQLAPDVWFLTPGVGAQGGHAATALAAAAREDGRGALIHVSRGIALAQDHREAALAYVKEMTQPFPAPILPHQDFIRTLFEIGAVQFGSFTLASGQQSPIYLDLRLLISHPSALAQAAQIYAGLIRNLPAQRLAGVPYAGLPLGAAVSLDTGIPLIFPRKEAKPYGRGRRIEGEFHEGERVIVIEDLVTTAGSLIQSVGVLREAGLIVEHAAVLIDREQGGAQNLASHGVQLHAAITISQLLHTLKQAGCINEDQLASISDSLSNTSS